MCIAKCVSFIGVHEFRNRLDLEISVGGTSREPSMGNRE